MSDTIIERCEAKGLRMTEQRRIIADVLEDSEDHPDVEALYLRASEKTTVFHWPPFIAQSNFLKKQGFWNVLNLAMDAQGMKTRSGIIMIILLILRPVKSSNFWIRTSKPCRKKLLKNMATRSKVTALNFTVCVG